MLGIGLTSFSHIESEINQRIQLALCQSYMNLALDWSQGQCLHIQKKLLLCGSLGVVWIGGVVSVIARAIVNLVTPSNGTVTSARTVLSIYLQFGSTSPRYSFMAFQEPFSPHALCGRYTWLGTASLPV